MTRPVRVRYAPSPTGKLHIGGARTALFNWAYARRHGGAFVLRVEDTDRERSTPENERAILEGLAWLGIDWDEGPEVGGPFGPYRQSERTESYLGTAAQLFRAGWAYRCFCSAERLADLRAGQLERKERVGYDRRCLELSDEEARARVEAGEEPVLRFRVPEGETRFRDRVRGEVAVPNADVDDWVMVRADGAPTYNFACVVDDAEMAITHVLRGEDHLTNTPKQLLLYAALGLEPPAFAHFPLMLGEDRRKLSKRTGDTALQDYRAKGYPPEAVVNFLCLQGWALDGATEIFSVDQLVEGFEIEDVSKAGGVFDPEKFLWMAGEYVRADDVGRLADRCAPFVAAAGLASEAELAERRAWFERVVSSERERIRLYSELPARIDYLFAPDDEVAYDESAERNARKQGTEALEAWLESARPRLVGATVPEDELREETKAWIAERGLKFPALFQPLRCALTGKPGGPDLFEAMGLLGPASSLRRIERGIERLRAPA